MEAAQSTSPLQWQPFLVGTLVRLRPLAEEDFESLYAVGSDPLIWEQHPDRERYRRARFESFFSIAMESRGALAIIDQNTGALIGTSRFCNFDPQKSQIEIGFTFLARSYWGTEYNPELKFLMLSYAFQRVNTASFVVGEHNLRSQKAMIGIGATEVNRMITHPPGAPSRLSVIYEIKKTEWKVLAPKLVPEFHQPSLSTDRMILEPVVKEHAEKLCALFQDRELHHFVPSEPLSLDQQRERCTKWEKRRSPGLDELWLNWLAQDKTTGEAIAHFQAGVKLDGVASIGYLVAKKVRTKE